MRIRIRWTHIFNLFIQFPIWIGSIVCGSITGGLFFALGLDNGFFTFLSIILFIVGVFTGSYFLYKWLQPIATIWYLAAFCKTSVTYREAIELTFLFDGSLNGKWYPFRDLKNIPNEYRKKILYEFAEKIMGYSFKTNPYRTRTYYEERYSENKYTKKEYKDTNYKNNENIKSKSTEDIYPNEYIKSCSIMSLNIKFTKEELKNKYRELMKQYHPDLFTNSDNAIKKVAEMKTIEINIAYEYLTKYIEGV